METLQYFGVITIDSIKNQLSDVAIHAKRIMDSSNVSFVHYPESQQLIIWLPNPGMEYHQIKVVETNSDIVYLDDEVMNQLNGSIQLLFNTSDYPPGLYEISIEMRDGISHYVYFTKHEVGWIPEDMPNVNDSTLQPAQDSTHQHKRFYDSNETPIPDDLDFRASFLDELVNKFSRGIEFQDEGRCGYVIYNEGKVQLKFNYEFGGGDCIAYINIPSECNWVTETNISLSRREDIISFVANTVFKEKITRGRMEISDEFISYYKVN